MLTVVVEVEQGRESTHSSSEVVQLGGASWERERARPSQERKLRQGLRAGLRSPGSAVSLMRVDMKSTFLRP